MADTGEQGAVGRAPHDPGSVKIDMGQGPPPVRKPPRPAPAGAGAGLAISALVALLCGGAGAWAYERFLSSPRAEKAPEPTARQGGEPGAHPDLASLKDRIDKVAEEYKGLTDQYRQLQSRLDAIPKPTPAPDLASLEARASQIDGLAQQLEDLRKRLDPLSEQVAQNQRKLSDLDARRDESPRPIPVARSRTPSGPEAVDEGSRSPDRRAPDQPAARAEPASPPPADRAEGGPSQGAPGDSTLQAGEGLFREGKYQEAYSLFRKLLQSQPTDARVWYYAALSYGLSTRDWGRATESMVETGVNYEKAGQPPRPQIDEAFAGLTKETGKEWLDFYRRRAQ